MPVPGGQIGYGVSITFQTGFLAMITNVDWDAMEVPDIDVSHNALVDPWKEFLAGKLKDAGQLTVELLHDPDEAPPLGLANETITLTWPKPQSGGSAAATWACQGYMKSYKAGAPMEDKMTATAVLKFSGKPTFTPHVA